jgi:NitT/TauT family transport system substrate-binding protein
MFMKKINELTALILITVFFAVTIMSCKGKDKVSAEVGKIDKLTIIYPTSVLSVPVVAVAKEKNYFKEEGLDTEFITLASGAIEALSIGKADLLLTGIIPTLSYAAQGASVRIIGGTISGGNYFIAKKTNAENLRNVENWIGKRFGVVRLSTSEMVTRYALEERGFTVEKNITYVEIDSYPNIIEGVRKGSVEIGAISPEYLQSALDLGLEVIFLMTELSPDYICCRETAYSKSLEAKPEAFVKFLKAQIRAYKDLIEHPDEVAKLLAKTSSQEAERVYSILFDTSVNGNRTFNPDPDLNRTRKVYETLEKWNYVEKGIVKIEDIFDTTHYKKALDEIIKKYPGEKFYQQLLEDYNNNNT